MLVVAVPEEIFRFDICPAKRAGDFRIRWCLMKPALQFFSRNRLRRLGCLNTAILCRCWWIQYPLSLYDPELVSLSGGREETCGEARDGIRHEIPPRED